MAWRRRLRFRQFWLTRLISVAIYLLALECVSSRQISRRRDSRVRFLNNIPSSLSLGSSCRSSLECLLFVANSQCDYYAGNICQCQSYHIALNNTMCVKASLLTFGCLLDSQCTMKVKNSRCGESKVCECLPNFMPFRFDKCLPPAKVEGYCLNDMQCQMHSRFAYCKYIVPRVYGKCRCPAGFTISPQGKCMPYLGSECDANDQCEYTTKDSQCFHSKNKRKNRCACRKGFTMSKNRMRCDPDPVAQNTTVPKPSLLTLKPNQTVNPVTQIVSQLIHMKPTSLGLPCNWTMECAARDPWSVCSKDTKRCECMEPTLRCSSEHTGCPRDTFQCRNGQCISWYFVCDGMKNCVDGSDETSCNKKACPPEAFQCDDGTCRSRAVVCNGKWECPDGSDEARCYKGVACDKKAFRCKNGQCVAPHAFCNSVADCADGSDEDPEQCKDGMSCPADSFQCNNGPCRSTAVVCSGLDGCGDGSDETGCNVCVCSRPKNSNGGTSKRKSKVGKI